MTSSSQEQAVADCRTLFACGSCHAIWIDPVTITCGHTFCRECLQKDSSHECPCCREFFNRKHELRTNVLLSAVVQKCFLDVVHSARLNSEKKETLFDRNFSEADGMISEDDEKAPDDNELHNFRSQLNGETVLIQETLEDVGHMTRLQPQLLEGHQAKTESSRNPLELSPSDGIPMEVPTKKDAFFVHKRNVDDDLSDRGSDSGHGSLRAEDQSSNSLEVNQGQQGKCVVTENMPGSVHKLPPTSVLEKENSNRKKQQTPEELLTTDDFECTLCLRLLFYPITTQCGHVFCRDCVYRSLDYRSVCPLCKESLAEFLAERREATTEAVEKIIGRFFAKELEMRSQLESEDMMRLPRAISDNRQEIPIFVCTIAYPCIPCPLRIFEPRYRLMMRRCMETGTRQFGMCTCLESHEENFYEYGTILDIRGIQYLPDGQSFVDCIGGRRFRVISRGMKDGYRTAEVEYLRDEPPSLEQIDGLQQLQADVHTQAVQWFDSIPTLARVSIVRSFGDIPSLMSAEDVRSSPDGPAWIWFMAAILPLDQRAQLSLLSTTSLKDRLIALHRVLEYFRREGYGS